MTLRQTLIALAITVAAAIAFCAGIYVGERRPVVCDANDVRLEITGPREYPVWQQTCAEGRRVLFLD